MKIIQTRNRILAIGLLFLFAVVMRLVPHLPNVTPIAAIAFASSLYIGKRWAFIVPLASMVVTDLFIGAYDLRIMMSVYLSFIAVSLISLFVHNARNTVGVYYAVTASSLLFFLITNASVWFFSPWYEKSVHGLLYAYTLGLPFLRNMLMGDLLYTAMLMGVFELSFCASRLKIHHVRRISEAVVPV